MDDEMARAVGESAVARWTDLPSLRRRGRTLPGGLAEGIEMGSEAGGVEV